MHNNKILQKPIAVIMNPFINVIQENRYLFLKNPKTEKRGNELFSVRNNTPLKKIFYNISQIYLYIINNVVVSGFPRTPEINRFLPRLNLSFCNI